MRQPLRNHYKFSEGERARVVAFLLVAMCSAGLGFLAVLHLDAMALFDGFSYYEMWIVLASGVGGMAALFFSGDKMGQSGREGAIKSVAGGVWLTFVGSLIGGTLALPLYGTMFGPFIVVVTLLGAPVLMLLWIVNLIGIHILLGIYQRERDSIFTSPPHGPTPHAEHANPNWRSRFS